MRVHDDVRRDALLCEWHVFLTVRHANRTLLTVAGRELVSDLRSLDGAYTDLDKSVALVIGGQTQAVNHAFLLLTHRRSAV